MVDSVRTAPERVGIGTDYDGTLAPIVEDPDRAVPDPRAVRALDELSQAVGVAAVVSGRPLSFLRSRLRLESVAYLGVYGLESWIPHRLVASREVAGSGTRELKGPSGPPETSENEPSLLRSWDTPLRLAADSAARLASEHPEDFRVEVKPGSVVLHFRRSPRPSWASRTAGSWAERISNELGLGVLSGKKNVEIVPPIPLGKGRALMNLVERIERPLSHLTFIGDDSGDIEAFEAVHRWAESFGRSATAVAVASEESDPALVVHADVVLEDQTYVASFLEFLAVQVRPSRTDTGFSR